MKNIGLILLSLFTVVCELYAQCSTYQLTTSQQNVSCAGLNDGSITVTNILGGTPPYNYYWGGPNGFVSNQESVDNLSFGVYSITVEDANGCFSVQSIINITQPFFNVQTSSNDVSCFGGSNGSGTINVIGGVLPISYSWPSLGLNSSVATNLLAGDYPILVTDNNNCQIADTISINQPLDILIEIDSITDVSCFGGADGEISVIVSGGTGNYSYLWTGDNNYLNSNNTNTISNLLSQTYNLKVSDQQNCETSQSIVVGQSVDIDFNSTIDDISCHGYNDGHIEVTVLGGNPPFNYNWSHGEITSEISNLSEGTYSLIVSDSLNCQKQSSFNVLEPLPLSTQLVTQNISCENIQDGSVNLNISGGTGNYYPTWNDTISLFNLTNLSEGFYYLTVSDDNDCTTSDSTFIVEPDGLELDIDITMNPSCFSYNDGMILCSSQGGTGEISYSWSDAVINSEQRVNLLAGQYIVTISDENACELSDTIILDEPSDIEFDVTINDHLCYGDSSASIFIDSIYGGNGIYSILWSNSSNSESLTNLYQDSITLNVMDQFNCSKQETFTFIQPNSISINFNIDNISCSGSDDGSISSFVSGGTGSYNLNWSTGDTLSSISNLNEGTYILTVSDSNNCLKSKDALITSPLPLSTIVTNQSPVSCYGGNDGKITLNTIGGTAPYTYSWSNGLEGSFQDSLSQGGYIIETIDANNCLDIDVINIEQPEEIIVNLNISSPTCFGDNNGEIQTIVQGGTPPYQHHWSNATFQSNLMSFAGVYSDSIVDFNSCHIVITDTIPQAEQIELDFHIEDISCSGFNNASINMSIVGGASPYLINWNTNDTTNFIDNLSSGTYTVDVLDSDNCLKQDTVQISEPINGMMITSDINQLQCFGDSSASISITVSGGFPPYSFLWSTGDTTSSINNLSSGVYTLVVTDTNGCSETVQTTIFSPDPIDANLEKDNISCYGLNDGSASVNVQGGSFPYTINWSTNDSSFAIENLSSGEYSFFITDHNNCTYNEVFAITEPDELLISFETNNISCFGDNNGSISSNIIGGNGFYNYLWSNNSTLSFIDNLSQGTYSLQVVDNKGCTKIDSSIIIEPPILSLVSTINHVSCFGQNNGSIDLFISGGTGSYYPLWNDSINEFNLDDLMPGNYHLTIFDENNCTLTDTVSINEPDLLTLQVDSFQFPSCYSYNDGKIFYSSQGGSGNIAYSWSDLAINSPQRLDLLAGQYIVSVSDENNCQVSDTIVLEEPADIEFQVITNNHLCFGDSAASVYIDTLYGGNGNYSIFWSNSATTDSLINLSLDSITLYISDGLNCFKEETYFFIQPDSIVINLEANDISCYGNNDGSINATITGGVGEYNLNWSNGDSLANMSDLSEGSYTLFVTDSNNCVSSQQTNIFSPDTIEVIINTESVSCFGLNDGSASLTVFGGSSPYSITWSTGDSTTSINGLFAGSYNVTIVDDNNCIYFEEFSIIEPNDIQIDLITNDISCNGLTNGSISSIVTGGNGSFSYSWTNNSDSSAIDSLNAGIYSLEVSDIIGCSKTAFGLINEPDELLISMNVNHTNCFGQNDGSIELFISGGSGIYNPLWNDSINLQNLDDLFAGQYHITVTDENNCTVTDSVQLNEPQLLTLIVDSLHSPTCFSENDGAIFCSSQGGTGVVTYNWADVGLNSSQRSNLTAGHYIVSIIDENACQFSDTIVVDQPTDIAFEVSIGHHMCFGDSSAYINIDTLYGGNGNYSILWSNSATSDSLTNLALDSISLQVSDQFNCSKQEIFFFTQPDSISVDFTVNSITCDGSDGSINAFINGGVGYYNFDWSTGDSTSFISNLSEGNYSLTVSDSNNCIKTQDIFLSYPVQIEVVIEKEEVSCFGLSDGSADLLIQSGSSPFEIIWSNGDTTNAIDNLSAGDYSVTVSDANNCIYFEEFLITEPDDLQISLLTTDISCFGTSDGSISAIITGGNGSPYEYLWSNNADSSQINNLNQGFYTLNVQDVNGCSKSALGVINEPEELTASAVISHIDCFGQNNGSIDLSVSGGTGQYTYLWNDNSSNQDLENIVSGFYSVIISDENGCDILYGDSVFQPQDPLSINDQIEHVSCFGEVDGSIQITAFGGAEPYSYIWSNGDNSTTLNNLSQGIYSLLLLDINGCVLNYSTTILSPDPLSITDSVIDESCLGSSDGRIFVEVSGGVLPYSYLWDNGSSNADISNLSSGSYIVQIQDSAGCVAENSSIVSSNESFDILYDQNDAFCFNQATASINLTLSGGTPPFSFLWSDGATNQNRNNIAAGEYFVTVTDSFNCTKTQNFVLSQPDSLVILVDIQEATCSSSNDGSIEITVSGGSLPYQYLWSNSENTSSIYDLYNGVYDLELTDANGCVINQSFDVDENEDCLKIPNVFTPNGDGDNDFWIIQNIDAYSSISIQLIDESGIPIYTSTSAQAWDGTINGNTIDSGIYFYIITLNNENIFTGSLTIIR